MSLLAIVLVILSAFVHAGWNLLSKSQRPTAAFFLVTTLTGSVLLSPFLVLSHGVVTHDIPARVWVMLGGTGFFMAMYCVCLAAAYRSGDLSVAYPLARSSPVIVVAVVALILGRSDQVSKLCIFGIILVVGGCFLIPLEKFGDFRLRNYLNATCGLALLAAVGTSGYSILDDEALRLLRTAGSPTLGNTRITMVYACLEALSASAWLGLFVVFRRNGRATFRGVLKNGVRNAVIAGVAIHLGYLLVLIALAFARNVSYIVGFRQLSIPLAATAGILILKEKPWAPKLCGVAVMFVGLMLLATG